MKDRKNKEKYFIKYNFTKTLFPYSAAKNAEISLKDEIFLNV